MTYLPKTKRNVQAQSLRHQIRSIPLLLVAAIAGLIVGVILSIVINDKFFTPETQLTIPRAEISIEQAYASEPVEIGEIKTEDPIDEEMTISFVTAYTCDPTMTAEQIAMNCPSLAYAPGGQTKTGTTPRHKITVACPKAELGKKFYLDGIGEVVCEDIGGAIKGQHRFDLFFDTYQEAIQFGEQYIEYREVK